MKIYIQKLPGPTSPMYLTVVWVVFVGVPRTIVRRQIVSFAASIHGLAQADTWAVTKPRRVNSRCSVTRFIAICLPRRGVAIIDPDSKVLTVLYPI
jgi:hypothetical protein